MKNPRRDCDGEIYISRLCEAAYQTRPKQSRFLDCFGHFVPSQRRAACGLAMTIVLLFGTTPRADAETKGIRVGHFPNVTHAPALVARAQRHFEKKFEGEARIEWKIFSAGPLGIEALFAGEIDILYTGPNPAVNGFVRSAGEALRIVSGVARGGSAFVVRRDSGIKKFEDIRGKRISIPLIGNSQDVALRHLMRERGLKSRSEGGDVEVFRIASGDQITTMARKDIDAIWTVEPWVSRLEAEAEGEILFEESELWPDGDYATAVLVVRKKFLEERPEWVKQWVEGHHEIVEWMNHNREQAREETNKELERETGHPLPDEYLNRSFQRIQFTLDLSEDSVKKTAERAYEIGYLGRKKTDLTELYDKRFLKLS